MSSAIVAVAQSVSPESSIPTPAELRPLEEELPQSPPNPQLQTPSPPPLDDLTPPAASFFVERIEVKGSTVLETEIANLVTHYVNREVTFEELLELRSRITQLYFDEGYITSGAFLPTGQNLSDGDVEIQVVEGRLEAIEISGLDRLQTSYVRDRLERADNIPLNQSRIEEVLQLLQLNPLIDRVNAELTEGSVPGQNILLVEVDEAPAFYASVQADNYQSPSIGSNQVTLQVGHGNVTGLGDQISGSYSFTEGLDTYDLSYAVPLNALDGTIGLRYSNDRSLIVEDAFDDLDIRSRSETFSLNFRQPVLKTPLDEFALGLAIDLRRSQTSILDEPFSFSEGPEDGESKVTVLRFSQDWVDRSATRVLAARSQFSFGLNALDATVNDIGTDGRFFAWLGQAQYVQQISPRVLILTSVDAQLTPDSLLPLERFAIGGVETVRGYAQNQLVTDNGILATIEARISLTSNPQQLQLTPFIDFGQGWNNRTPDPDPQTIAGVGLGLRWLITPDLALRADYGIPLIEVEDEGNSLQEEGIYFSLRYQAF